MDVAGMLAVPAIYAAIVALHLILPARRVAGYVRDAAGRPLRYRLNGIAVLAIAVVAWAALARGWVAPDWLFRHRHGAAIGAAIVGLVFTFAVVLPLRRGGGGALAQLYLGRRENPQLLGGRIDLKMLLYLVGAVMLQLNLLSYAAHAGCVAPAARAGVMLHLGLFSAFVLDYLAFEHVHLYTYDLFAERVGFKLGWGCLAFYPFFYSAGLASAVAHGPSATPTPALVAVALTFVAGWCLARGANLQKYHFKRDPQHRFLGLFTPVVIEDGTHRVLCSGFWGVSRHVNYLGEILMASALAAALSWPPSWGSADGPLGWLATLVPWSYPLYYVLLLVPRQRDDDRRCQAKYGPLWDEYRRRVRWRIVPGLY